MPAATGLKRTGRRGRRTGAMVRIARERVSDLFVLAEREARGHHLDLANRYVALARRIGMRYNVRLGREYRELYCRACSAFWVEGATVRTRLRSGYRVRTCLRCGRQRRTLTGKARSPLSPIPHRLSPEGRRDEGALAIPIPDVDGLADEETEEE